MSSASIVVSTVLYATAYVCIGCLSAMFIDLDFVIDEYQFSNIMYTWPYRMFRIMFIGKPF